MNVMCSTVRVALQTVGDSAITAPLAGHVESCDSCREAVGLVASVRADLRRLPIDEFPAPSGFYRSVMSSLGPVAVPDLEGRHSKTVPIAVATAAVATAAASTAVILHLRRTRVA